MWKVFNLPSNSTETLNSECSCLPSAQRQLGFPHLRWRSTKEPGSISRNAPRLRMSLPRRSRSWSPSISTSNTNGRQSGSQGYCNICKNDLGQIRLGTRRSFSGLVGQAQARCEIAGGVGAVYHLEGQGILEVLPPFALNKKYVALPALRALGIGLS